MVTEFWARLEDASGRIVGQDPAWTPSRQFLWEVVHDTRGLLREATFQDDADLIRRIDDVDASHGADYALEPERVLAAYERIRAQGAKPDAPRFRLVAPAGTQMWAAVHFFEESGAEYALVGGWTGPVLRAIAPEPDQSFLSDEPVVSVGSRSFDVRAVPFADYFSTDFASLAELLSDAKRRGLRVRFLQR